MNDESIKIVISAQNKASKVFASMRKDLNKVKTSAKAGTKKINDSFKRTSATLDQAKFALVGVALAAGALGKSMLNAASDAVETNNKFKAVFQDQAAEAEKFVQSVSESLGRSKTDTRDALSSFQGFAKGMGLSGKEALAFSTELQSLSLDFASFNNLTDQESLQRFISGLSGSAEVFDRFGVNLKASNLDLKLLEMGLPKVSQGATELQKAVARLELIRDTMGTQGAIGDAIRTSDEFVGTTKRLSGQLKDLKETIGAVLIPIFKPLVSFLTKIAEKMNQLSPTTQKVIGISIVLTAALAGLGVAMIALTPIIGSMGILFTVMTGPIGAVIATVAALIAIFATDFLGIRTAVETVGEVIGSVLFTMVKKFKSAFEAITLLAEAFAETMQSIGDRIADALSSVFGDTAEESRASQFGTPGTLERLQQQATQLETSPSTTNNESSFANTNNIVINSNQDPKTIADEVSAKLSRDIKIQSLGG